MQAAFVFLTRLPVPLPAPWSEDLLSRAVWVFPIVGATVGLICALIGWLSGLTALPSAAASLTVILAGILATGGLHEDGLADTADGFGGGRDPAQKLAIMKDSRIGSYGVLALFFSAGFRAAAIAALLPEGFEIVMAALVAAHAGSRSAMPVIIWLTPLARQNGLAAAAGRPLAGPVLAGAGIGVAAVMACLGFERGLLALAATALVTALVMLLARRQIGGYTGDVLGAAQQLTELAILLVAARGLGD